MDLSLEDKVESYFNEIKRLNGGPSVCYEMVYSRLKEFEELTQDCCSIHSKIMVEQCNGLKNANICNEDIISNIDYFNDVFQKTRVINCLNCPNVNCQVGYRELKKYLPIISKE